MLPISVLSIHMDIAEERVGELLHDLGPLLLHLPNDIPSSEFCIRNIDMGQSGLGFVVWSPLAGRADKDRHLALDDMFGLSSFCSYMNTFRYKDIIPLKSCLS